MEDKFTGLLYRSGPETASNTQYLWTMDEGVLTKEQRGTPALTFVRRYDSLSGEQVTNIEQVVSGYQGRQDTLIQRIDEILNFNRVSKSL